MRKSAESSDRLHTIRLLVFVWAILLPATGSAAVVMVVAPHPDDEALMTAGIIHEAVRRGDEVTVVIVTNGDGKGTAEGHSRLKESTEALRLLGVDEFGTLFLGYGDGTLMDLYGSDNASRIIPSAAGRRRTYGDRGRGGKDFHSYRFGSPADYTRENVAGDFEAIIDRVRPDDIYTTSSVDDHPDHRATYLFLVDAVVSVMRRDPRYAPGIHEYMIHAPCKYCDPNYTWPNPSFTPEQPFPKPPFLDLTPLSWEAVERVPVPAAMRGKDPAANLKYRVLRSYSTQGSGWILSFIKGDEISWRREFAANVALRARTEVSSEDTATGQLGVRAVDGVADGFPRTPRNEWTTRGELEGAWITLVWDREQTVGTVILHDRPNLRDRILAGTLSFSDGTSLPVGALPNAGAGLAVSFPPKRVTWVKFRVDRAAGLAAGLSEIEVLADNPTPKTAAITKP